MELEVVDFFSVSWVDDVTVWLVEEAVSWIEFLLFLFTLRNKIVKMVFFSSLGFLSGKSLFVLIEFFLFLEPFGEL